MKKIIFLLVLFFSLLSIAQENYETIIMPKKFDFQKEENQYNLNTVCKLFFEKEGFKVYYEEDLSEEEFFQNRCNYIYLNLNDNSSLFNTKISVDLKDCKKGTLIQSKEAKTREKEYYKAYNEVVRDALLDLRGKLSIKNNFNLSTESSVLRVDDKKQEVEVVKQEKSESDENNTTNSILYSKVTKNGYNLVDINGNTKFELLKTSNPTIFIAKKENLQGIFTLNGQNSKFESYQNNELVVEKVEVKF